VNAGAFLTMMYTVGSSMTDFHAARPVEMPQLWLECVEFCSVYRNNHAATIAKSGIVLNVSVCLCQQTEK